MIKLLPIKQYIKKLPLINFLTFDIKYSQKEIDYFENFDIIKKSNFEYYGDIDSINDTELNDFISKLGNNQNISIFNNVIHKLINRITKAYNTNYCWLSIRVDIPKNDFDIPRWHADGNFFVGSDKIQTKFATVLKGPGTLFIKKSKKIYDIYLNHILERRKEFTGNDEALILKYRKILANKLENVKHHQLKKNQGILFLVGQQQDKYQCGLIHSEPKIDTMRIFISILPGSESEITNLYKRRYN